MVYAADQYLRKFLGIASVRNPAIGMGPNYEDPTYPIFNIRFLFTAIDSKHPDYVSNRLLSSGPESAVQFLYSVGEPERALMMEKFITLLQDISLNTPWYFQKVTGLEQLYNQGYISSERGYGSGSSSGLQSIYLKVDTLESIDHKIHALKDLYRKAAYDRKYRRWILPINMRRFRMRILVGDYRQMAITEDNYSINPRQALDALRDIDVFNGSNIGGKLLGKVNDGALSFVKRLQWWDNHFSCILFDCQDCEFDMSGFPQLLDHKQITPASSSFGINVGRVLESNTYSLLKYVVSDNILENKLKSENESEIAKISEMLKEEFKPIVPSWRSYQNLEREKGDNKRIILDDGGFSNALGAGISEVADGLGIGGILGGGSNFGGALGSVGNFVADTGSELAQQALGLATEQIASNVYGNELTRSAAGVGLGILNGDLNQVAQNFSNPALAGALGINVESTGRPVQPNLRDGVPSKIDLVAPSVQRSLSDVQANLTGEGSDPRFQSIGRPGQSLFSNPNTINRTFDQTNIELIKPRVETEMPDNVNFTEVRKETKLNPSKETLTGSTPKTKFDETNADLQGAGKKTDLTPSNADLTGAEPLKDLIPSNAELNGAEPLKDLIPNNADLTGAEPLKDLIPSNAELNGAEPLKDLIPNNADLTGAEPLKDLIPSNAELNGAEPLKDLIPSNAELNGAEPLKDLIPNNADLTGAESLKDLIPSNAELNGAESLKDLIPSNAELNGNTSETSFNSENLSLLGSSPLNTFNTNNVDLIGTRPIKSFDENNANLIGASSIKNFSDTNIDLVGSLPQSTTENSIELVGAKPLTEFTETNVKFQQDILQRERTLGNSDLVGISPKNQFTESNVGNMITDVNQTESLGTEQLIGSNPMRDFSIRNIDLVGNTQNSTSIENINLQGSQPQTTMNNNIDLVGKKPLDTMSRNINLQGVNPIDTMDNNIELKGKQPLTNMTMSNIELNGAEPLKGSLTNINLTGKSSIGILNPSRIELKEPNINNSISPKNIDLR